MIIRAESRFYWDVFIIIVLVICAFEVPFSILVGWENRLIGHFFNGLFYITFTIDIFLNCITQHHKRYTGIWGWRAVAGLFFRRFSSEYKRGHDTTVVDETISTQPRVMKSYLTSGWFLIDFISVFPFELIASSLSGLTFLRVLRLGRFFKLIRLLRAVKSIKIINLIKNFFSKRPSVGRTILIIIGVCFLGHIHACLFYYFESTTNDLISSYQQALYSVYLAFATAQQEQTFTNPGFIISISSVITGLMFFGLLIGNFSTFFEEMDQDSARLDESIKKWNSLFAAFPAVFDVNLRNGIIEIEKDRLFRETKLEDFAILIQSLDERTERKITSKIIELNHNSPTPEREALLRCLSSKDCDLNL